VKPVLWTAFALALVLTACAGDEAPAPVLSEHAGPRHGGLPNLFISPFGEPFRSAPGEPYPVIKWFVGADLNHDGRIDRDEFRHDGERFFRRLDTNHDGVIDGFEISAYEQAIAPEILPRLEGLTAQEGWTRGLGGRGDPARSDRRASKAGGGLTQGAGLFSLLDEEEPVAAADADLDGRVTLAEFRAAADRRFDALDPSRNGFLTRTGLPKTPVETALDKPRKR